MQEFNVKKYAKFGIMISVIIAVFCIGFFGFSKIINRRSIEQSISSVSTNAVNFGDLKVAIIKMDVVQMEAKALKNLKEQKENYEKELKAQFEKKQKELEQEKKEIEKSQDMLSRDALQRRVADYQSKIAKFQRDISEKAQKIEMSYQKALVDLQERHLDPLIQAIIDKKHLSLIIDGRFVRSNGNVKGLDITKEVIEALDKKISKFKMSNN